MKPRFVIFGAMRTGSQYLEALINQVDECICYGEVFNPKFVGLRGSMNNHFGLKRVDVEKRDNEIESVFERTVEAHPNKITGFRFFPGHHPYVLDRVLGDGSFRRVLLKRDVLTSFVSLCQARESGIWKISAGKKGDAKLQKKKNKRLKKHDRKIHFKPIKYSEYRKKLQSHYRKIEENTAKRGLPIFTIRYKELHNSEKIDELFDFIGANAKGQNFEETIIKQSPSRLSDRVENYDEMIEFLKAEGEGGEE